MYFLHTVASGELNRHLPGLFKLAKEMSPGVPPPSKFYVHLTGINPKISHVDFEGNMQPREEDYTAESSKGDGSNAKHRIVWMNVRVFEGPFFAQDTMSTCLSPELLCIPGSSPKFVRPTCKGNLNERDLVDLDSRPDTFDQIVDYLGFERADDWYKTGEGSFGALQKAIDCALDVVGKREANERAWRSSMYCVVML